MSVNFLKSLYANTNEDEVIDRYFVIFYITVCPNNFFRFSCSPDLFQLLWKMLFLLPLKDQPTPLTSVLSLLGAFKHCINPYILQILFPWLIL